VKALIFAFVLCFFEGLMLRAEEASPGKPAVQSIADIPKEYEIGEKSLSPNGRFAILYPFAGTTALSCHRISWSVSNRTQS
jgi:hypothetical protein